MAANGNYAGLGAALGVPQSALESVTSLDPKDYQYPTLSSGFSFTFAEEMVCKGAQETMQVLSLRTPGSIAASSGIMLGQELGSYGGGMLCYVRL